MRIIHDKEKSFIIKKDMVPNTRNPGIDIIRITAMIMVTSIHFLVYSKYKESLPDCPFYNRLFINILSILNKDFINLFVLISGYLLCKKTDVYKKIIPTWMMVYVTCIIVSVALFPIDKNLITSYNITHSLLPILLGNYWYFGTYFLLLIIAPFLNQFVKITSKTDFKFILLIFGFIITVILGFDFFVTTTKYIGPQYSLVWFVYLYLFGAYIKVYGLEFNKVVWAVLFVTSLLLSLIVIVFNIHLFSKSLLVEYSLLPFINSFSLFYLLLNTSHPKSQRSITILQEIGSSAVFVYIIQENPFCRELLWKWVDIDSYFTTPWLAWRWFMSIIALFAVSYIIYRLYLILHKAMLKRLEEKIEYIVYSLIKSIKMII